MKRIPALVLVLALTAALFAGCSPAGVYHVRTIDGMKPAEYFQNVIEEDFDVEMDEFLSDHGIKEKELEDPYVLELKRDGTFTFQNVLRDGTEKGEWRKDGDTLNLTLADGKTVSLKISGGTLVADKDELFEGAKVVFGR